MVGEGVAPLTDQRNPAVYSRPQEPAVGRSPTLDRDRE